MSAYPEVRGGWVTENVRMDAEAFVRDGYVALRGAVDPDTVAACRELIWAGLAERGVRRDQTETWPVTAQFDDLAGSPFSAAGWTRFHNSSVNGTACRWASIAACVSAWCSIRNSPPMPISKAPSLSTRSFLANTMGRVPC